MAAKRFMLPVTVTHDANKITIAQFLQGTNKRGLIHAVRLSPLGPTSATAPLYWLLGTQDGPGTSVSANNDLIKVPPAFAQAIETTALKTFSGEPAASTPMFDAISVHQQSAFTWVPPLGPVVMEAAERWALWYPAGQGAVTVRYEFHLEE
jgi:hypothetical protein